jgi:pimeloyl-ACP methyl ester carboxylesterase
MTTFVLVHGGNLSTDAWNKLAKRTDYPPGGHLGGKIWDTIVPTLQANNHRVFAPTLLDEYTFSLSDHVEQICQLIRQHNLNDIILVGASYGGMVITGVADRMADKIRLLVYLDAALPEPGQSLFDLLMLGNLIPSNVTGGSAKAYIEKLFFDQQRIRSLPKLYILCTESSFSSVTALAKRTIDADGTNWTYVELKTTHVPQASAPDQLIQVLLSHNKDKVNT